MAATEFALLMPFLVLLFFGTLEVADGMTANRRVSLAANTASDLSSQDDILTPSEINGLLDSASAILATDPATTLDINIVSVVLDNNDDPVVHWSVNWDGSIAVLPPYVPGSDYAGLGEDFKNNQAGLVQLRNRSLIVVEMTYKYYPTFTSKFVSEPINFKRTSIRAPRLSPRVQLCDETELVCTS